jgi:hypothetical protein
MYFEFKLGFALVPALILANGCGFGYRTPQVAGVYKGSTNCPDCTDQWNGASEIVLNQSGRNLTGILRIHHATAASVLVPLSAGVIGDDVQISLAGQAQLPSGSIEVTFTGQYQASRIGGSAILVLRSPLAGSREQNTILRLKNMS